MPKHRKDNMEFSQEWLNEREKAAQLGMSVSFLQKDRLKSEPLVPFRRIGRMIRYSRDA